MIVYNNEMTTTRISEQALVYARFLVCDYVGKYEVIQDFPKVRMRRPALMLAQITRIASDEVEKREALLVKRFKKAVRSK